MVPEEYKQQIIMQFSCNRMSKNFGTNCERSKSTENGVNGGRNSD